MKFGAFIGAIVVSASVIVAGHHGQAGLFDESRIVELKGTVKQWNFINPHPILVLDAPDASGVRKDWDIYFGPGAVPSLRRQGFAAETFKVGDITAGRTATRNLSISVTGTSVDAITQASSQELPVGNNTPSKPS